MWSTKGGLTHPEPRWPAVDEGTSHSTHEHPEPMRCPRISVELTARPQLVLLPAIASPPKTTVTAQSRGCEPGAAPLFRCSDDRTRVTHGSTRRTIALSHDLEDRSNRAHARVRARCRQSDTRCFGPQMSPLGCRTGSRPPLVSLDDHPFTGNRSCWWTTTFTTPLAMWSALQGGHADTTVAESGLEAIAILERALEPTSSLWTS
jgi:hypothetical protein